MNNSLIKVYLIACLVGCGAMMSAFSPDAWGAPGASGGRDFAATVGRFTTASFNEKARIIDDLSGLQDPRVPLVLDALLHGELYYDKKSRDMVVLTKVDGAYLATEVLSGKQRGAINKRSVKKVSVNNSLRRQLRSRLAAFRLNSSEPELRLIAAQEILKAPSREFLQALDEALSKEEAAEIREAMELARAAVLLGSEDAAERLQAVESMADASDHQVVTMLELLLVQSEQGEYAEPDEAVRAAARQALIDLHTRAKLYRFLEDLFFGMSLGSVLLLAAVGLAITFGVMGVINMAHGEMIMLGAYTTYVIQLLMPNQIGLSLVVAIPAAFLVSGLFGVAIERGVIRFLYGRPLETLLATFGISLILQQLVRSIFTPLNRSVITPEWLSGSWQVNGMLSLTYNRLYIIIFAILVLLALIQLLKRTFFGLQMRAVTQNRAMASSMGIRTGWVDALTFGLGSGVAGIAGVALSQLTNVGPNLGQSYIIDSFMVVVFGGVGNLMGTFVGAMSLGIVNKFAEPFTGAVLAKILILVFVILFIQRRPRGLFALKGRFVED